MRPTSSERCLLFELTNNALSVINGGSSDRCINTGTGQYAYIETERTTKFITQKMGQLSDSAWKRQGVARVSGK